MESTARRAVIRAALIGAVIGAVLGLLVPEIARSLGEDDYSETRKAALEGIAVDKKALAAFEKELPSGNSFGMNDTGIGEYVGASGIDSAVEELRTEIGAMELLLRDEEAYEDLYDQQSDPFDFYDPEVDDFRLGWAIAEADDFSRSLVELRRNVEIADDQLTQIRNLRFDLLELNDVAPDAKVDAEIERLFGDLAALYTIYTDPRAMKLAAGKRLMASYAVLRDAIQREKEEGFFVAVEDIQLEIQRTLDVIQAGYRKLLCQRVDPDDTLCLLSPREVPTAP